jgi:hypothetical protein
MVSVDEAPNVTKPAVIPGPAPGQNMEIADGNG